MGCLCAEVLTFGIFEHPLLYVVPERHHGKLSIGSLVRVPFGRQKIFGIVTEISLRDIQQLTFEVKAIDDVVYDSPVIGRDMIELITWMRKYYAVSYKSLLEMIIPISIRKNLPPKFSTKLIVKKFLSPEACETMFRRSPKQGALYQFLSSQQSAVDVQQLQDFTRTTIDALVNKGLVEKITAAATRTVYGEHFACGTRKPTNIVLNAEQRSAAEDISRSLMAENFQTHLLHGVTGSGKTEVYMHVIELALRRAGEVIYLVPELTLTPQTVARIRSGLSLSATEVVVWHSGLSEGERRDAWFAMSNAQAKVVIGARSAIFSPFKRLKLIIVDEEHEATYKQAETPRYHARDVAVYRAKLCSGVCVLGSATPAMESFFNTQRNKYKINTLAHRVDTNVLPAVEVVDMRLEDIKHHIISRRLEDLIRDRLDKHEQIILFLNKRGYSSVISCGSCDYVASCPNCSVSTTYHKQNEILRCHICGYFENFSTRCPKCGNPNVVQSGIGTQKLLDVVSTIFPSARVARIDSDCMTTKYGFYHTLNRFGSGEIDILVGTQMISKGLDFPNISLVGIVNVDSAMNLPDFRTGEKVFQSIVQVSGRAGRGNKPGYVIIQTRSPDSQMIQCAIKHDFDAFYNSELLTRKEFFYPPFSHIIRIIISGRNEERVKIFSALVSKELYAVADGKFDVRGPAPAPIEKINHCYRYSVVCFCSSVVVALSDIRPLLGSVTKPNDINVIIDVDAVDMM